MPATLLLDRDINGTLLDNGVNFVRAIRCGIVKDIDVNAVGFDPNVMVKALGTQGMPQLNDPHPSIGNCKVQRHLIRGMSNDQAKVEIWYETPQHGAALPQPGSYLINGSTGLQTEQCGLDSNGIPIYTTYSTLGSGTIQQIGQVSRLVPFRCLKITGIIFGEPDPNTTVAVGCVNMGKWQGLAQGFWLCNGFSFETDDLAITYRVEASFISRVYRDWKEYVMHVDPLTGSVPDPVIQPQYGNLSKIAKAINLPYPNAPKQDGATANGFTTIAFYKTCNFAAIFGF